MGLLAAKLRHHTASCKSIEIVNLQRARRPGDCGDRDLLAVLSICHEDAATSLLQQPAERQLATNTARQLH
jgi:hypothetical protein